MARFIGAHNRRDVAQIAALYDDAADYLGSGQGPRSVATDKQALFAAWPEMRFKLGSKIEYELAEDGQAAVLAFVVDFTASNTQEARQGRVREVMQLRLVEGGLKITAERHVDPQ